MSEEKKEEGCCGTHGSGGGCCAGKKLFCAIVFGILIFVAGMMFAKVCPLGKTCPFSAAPAQQR